MPRANRDLLMLAPSYNQTPQLFVTVAHSDPARSIKANLLYHISTSTPASLSLCSIDTNNTACDLELVRFASVASVVLL